MPFRLRTFGGLSLTGESGPVTGAAAQRRKLALLAVLATGGERGVSRDRLLALFWPERDAEHARHALTQALWALRHELGSDELFLGTADLRLNPALIESDVAAFEDALERGELERAARLYTGPFLDAVHLDHGDEAPEFEHWADAERARLRGLAVDALERLAANGGDHRTIAGYWERLVAMDPLDARLTIRYMSALAAAGNRARAVRHARAHSALVREELGAAAEPEVLALAERLQHQPSEPHAVPAQREAAAVPNAVAALPPVPGMLPRHPRPVGAALVVVAVAVGALALLRVSPRPALDAQKVAVAVFENRTGDPRLDVLGPIAADWLTQGLARTDLVKVADVRDELAASRFATRVDRQRETLVVQDFGLETGAGTVVRGWYTQQGDTLEFTAEIVDARRGSALVVVRPTRAARRDPLRGLVALRLEVTRALASLLSPGLAAWTSLPDRLPTFAAYREYLQGVEKLPDDQTGAALHLKGAFALDSTFTSALVLAVGADVTADDMAAADSLIRLLEPRLRQLTPFERYKLNESRALMRGDNAAASENALLALGVMPGSLDAIIDAAGEALNTNHPREAVRLLSEVDPEHGWLRGWEHYWWMLTSSDHMLGDYRQELVNARRGRRLFPNLLTTLANEIRALAALGRVDDVQRDLDESMRLRSSGWFTHLFVMVMTGQELRVHGHEAAAQRVFDRALTWYTALPSRDRQADEWTYAGLLGALGRWKEARVLYEKVWGSDPRNLQAAGWAGEAAAAMGDRRGAMRVAAVLAAWPWPYRLGLETDGRARIEAALGDRERAVALLREAFAQGRVYTVYTHWSTPGLWGYPPFLELLRPRG